MTYIDTVNWMFSRLPMYQRQGKSAYKADLSNTILLVNKLGNPQKKFKTIHVAGTNGKGSTCHMLASILQESGIKVGLFTSPHLKDFRERIRINGKPVSQKFVVDFINNNKNFFEKNELSFFEMTAGMAFHYFASQQVDIAVVEVGLGGRLDSTNIIMPEVSVITNIGFDHMQFLGDTLKKIAIEKAGIIKPNIPVVIGETQEDICNEFQIIALKNHSEIYFADQLVTNDYECDLKGAYQKQNIKTAIQTIKILDDERNFISEYNIINGLKNVINNTGLKGRWQVLEQKPDIICDTAHNREGLKIVMNQLLKENYDKLFIVFGVVTDKDLNTFIDLLPKQAYYLFCKPDVPRGLNAEDLYEFFESEGFRGEVCSSVKNALNKAKLKAEAKDLIYVGGSTFVVAEII